MLLPLVIHGDSVEGHLLSWVVSTGSGDGWKHERNGGIIS